MSAGETAPNPQNPSLHQILQESTGLVNELADGFNIFGISVGKGVYDLYRQERPEPGRQRVRLRVADGGGLITSDVRSVTSMALDVPESTDVPDSDQFQTCYLSCAFDVTEWHEVALTVASEQQVDIVNVRPYMDAIVNGRIEKMTPVYWRPISDPDVEGLLTVFHDALQVAKLLDEEKKTEIREHNKLLEEYRKILKQPDDLLDQSSSS